MIRQAGQRPVFTQADLPALTNATILGQFQTNNNTTAMTIFQLDWGEQLSRYALYMTTDGKLKFCTAYSILSGTQGVWSCNISAGNYLFALKYNFGGSDSAVPVIYLNGVKQTLTQESAPKGTSANSAGRLVIGGKIYYYPALIATTETEQFGGRQGDYHVYTRQLTDAECEDYTKAKIKGFAYFQRPAGCILYCPMDELNDSTQNISVTNTIVPNGDISGTWTTKTQSSNWESLNADSTDYVEAGGSDDGISLIMDTSTFTIPAGSIVSCIDFHIKGYASTSGVQPSVSILKGSTWYSLTSITLPVGSTSGDIKMTYVGDSWTQAEIDGLQIKITAPTLSKSDTIRIYYAYVNVFTVPEKLRDYKGSYHLIGTSATGSPESNQSYL